PVTTTNEPHLLLGQLGQQNFVEDLILAIDLLVGELGNPRQRLMRLQAVGTGLLAGVSDLLLQARHTNLEKLIEVAGEDQQELQPLQQRIGLIQRLFQHADIELQLRKLAMDVQAAVVQVRRRQQGYRLIYDHLFSRAFGQYLLQRFAGGACLQFLFVESLTIHRSALEGLLPSFQLLCRLLGEISENAIRSGALKADQ